MEVNMQKSGDNFPCPHENRIRISNLLYASTLLFVTEITKNALSLRITVLVELCLLICSTKRKTGLQLHHVKMCKCGICMECGRFFHSIHQIFHSILEPHSIFHTDFFLPFHTIPYHSMPWRWLACHRTLCQSMECCFRNQANRNRPALSFRG